MQPRISTRFFGRCARRAAAPALAALVALLSARPALACAGGDPCEDTQCNSFFSPEIVGDAASAPFFYSEKTFYDQQRTMLEESRDALSAANVGEWAAFFDVKVSTDQLAYLLYAAGVKDVDGLILTLKGKNAPMTASARELLGPLSKSRRDAVKALYYLGFAKRVEPFAVANEARDAWEPQAAAPVDPGAVAEADKLIAGGESLLKGASDSFLRERYRFQLLRLLFYTGRYDRVVDEYRANQDAFTSEGSVKYRAMELAAGALYHKNDYAHADYLYSRIFDRYAPLKKNAFRSFHPVEEADWQATLALARDKREAAALWQMFGLYADGIVAIEKIRALDPKSPLLALLLVREVNKAEAHKMFRTMRARMGEEPAEEHRVSPALLAAVRRVADAGDAARPALWNLALAHLLAMDGDAAGAQARLALVEKSAGGNPAAAEQARMTRLFARVRGLSAPDPSAEGYFAQELRWLAGPPNPRAAFLSGWALGALGAVYEKAGDLTRSLMLSDVPTADVYRDNAKLEEFVAFQKRSGKSAFDAFLAEHHGYTANQLADLEGTNSLYAGRYAQAAALFGRETGDDAKAKLPADPFVDHIDDCHDCDFAAAKSREYTKASFAARLGELERSAAGTGEPAARASFLLATGLYNMSYFGNSRAAYQTAHDNFEPSLARHMDMSGAGKWYQRAVELSRDREFQARAAFMAAKAEHNALYAAAAKDIWDLQGYFDRNPYPAGRYYRFLKDSYADTKYYAEILEECGYFKKWAQSEAKAP